MFFKSGSLLLGLALTSSIVHRASAWTLQSTASGSSFFDSFTFFTGADPTNGFVDYVDEATATSSGLIYTLGEQVIIKADNTTTTSTGRASVRITSTASYNSGLFILDLEHMPTGCGTWPAYWLVGPSWPNTGEIDVRKANRPAMKKKKTNFCKQVIEGVNDGTYDQSTLHTSSGCTMTGQTQTGTVSTTDCYVYATEQSSNAGCGVVSTDSSSYGPGFNSINGGVYATSFTSSGVNVWFFPRSSIPSDITSGAPNPDSWGTPSANFPFTTGTCSTSYFQNLQIVINLTFCGDWAGAVYGSSGCPSTCTDYVGNNPSDFSEAYWSINSLKVYSQ